MRDEFNEIYNDICRYGASKPLWITEVGWFAPHKWSVPWTPYKNSHIAKVLCTEEQCARWFTQLAVTAFAHHVEKIQYFIFEEGNITDRWFHGFTGPNYNSLKAAYFAAAACVRNTDFSKVLGQEQLFEKLHITGFNRNGTETQVLWTKEGAIDLEIRTIRPLHCEDLYGNPFTLTPKNGKVWLTVNGDAVYLKCPRSAISICPAPFSLVPHLIQVKKRQKAILHVTGRLPGRLQIQSGFLAAAMRDVPGPEIILRPRPGLQQNEKYQVLAMAEENGNIYARLQWSVVAGEYKGSVNHPKTGRDAKKVDTGTETSQH